MLKRWMGLSGFAILCAVAAGCRHTAPSASPALPPPLPQVSAPVASPVTGPPVQAVTADSESVQNAVQNLLAKDARSKPPRFPKGARLRNVVIVNDQVTLNFNRAFQRLADMGDSNEGEAQRDLCRALAPLAGLTKLSVKVEGGPFDSQMADWTKPFPIHSAELDADSKGAK